MDFLWTQLPGSYENTQQTTPGRLSTYQTPYISYLHPPPSLCPHPLHKPLTPHRLRSLQKLKSLLRPLLPPFLHQTKRPRLNHRILPLHPHPRLLRRLPKPHHRHIMREQAVEIAERIFHLHDAQVLRVLGLICRDGKIDELVRSAEDEFGRFGDVVEAEAALCGGDGVGEEGDEGGVGVCLGRFEQGGEGLEGLGEAWVGLVGEVGDVDSVELEVGVDEGGEVDGVHAV